MGYEHIGRCYNDIHAVSKVTGQAKYVGDMKIEDMLYGKVLWSTKAHARIKRINTEKAKALPGVKTVITWEDVPRNNYCPAGHPYPDDSPQDMYILDNVVRFVGDSVAAIAADSPEIAARALELIDVEYEELPAILSIEDALKEDAVEIHKDTKNICGQHSYEFGNVSKGFADSDLIVEDEFHTPIVQHCSIENHVSLARVENDGTLTIYSATQIPFHLRRILAHALGLPIGSIRVIKGFVGGGFGGKEDVCQEAINAVLALKTGKPVLLELNREEDIVSTRTRHSMIFKFKTGVSKDGKLLAREMHVFSNTGAYAGHGHCVVYNIDAQFPCLYPTPNIAFHGTTVYTNMPIASAMRSYGIAQYNFAMESHMDNIAKRLKMDPLELRKKNIVKEGFKDPQGYFTVSTCGIEDCLDKGEKLSKWKEPPKAHQNKYVKVGKGMACFSYASSTFPYNAEMSGARIKMNEDGSIVLFIGSADIGQGNDTIMAQIAAEELGLSLDAVKVIAVDTDLCPFDMGAYASRQANICGMAVKKAAQKCRSILLDCASKVINVSSGELQLKSGWIINRTSGFKYMPIKDMVMEAYYSKGKSIAIDCEDYFTPGNNPLCFGAVFVEIEVDTGTGKIEVRNLWAIHDSGKIINHQTAQGQVHGGAAMGVGYGVLEQLLIDKKTGRTLNNNLLDYKLPTILDIPDIDVHFVETIEPSTAYGNKALGEPPCISVAPAIRNALLNALDLELNAIPLTPERVLRGIKEENIKNNQKMEV